MDELAEGLRGMRGRLGALYRQVQLQHAREHIAGSRRAVRLHPQIVLQKIEAAAGAVSLHHTEPLDATPQSRGDAIPPNATAKKGTAGTGVTASDFVPPAVAARTEEVPNGGAVLSTHRIMSARSPSPTRRYWAHISHFACCLVVVRE